MFDFPDDVQEFGYGVERGRRGYRVPDPQTPEQVSTLSAPRLTELVSEGRGWGRSSRKYESVPLSDCIFLPEAAVFLLARAIM